MHLLEGLLCLGETCVHSALVFEVSSAFPQKSILVPKLDYLALELLTLLASQPLCFCDVLDKISLSGNIRFKFCLLCLDVLDLMRCLLVEVDKVLYCLLKLVNEDLMML